jgi:hypothetical protein
MLAFPEFCTKGECQENRPDPHYGEIPDLGYETEQPGRVRGGTFAEDSFYSNLHHLTPQYRTKRKPLTPPFFVYFMGL